MSKGRPLSLAEEQGWRQFWDGWVICPPCIEQHLAQHRAAFRNDCREWPVPADYDWRGIGAEESDRCCCCDKLPPLELTWRKQAA